MDVLKNCLAELYRSEYPEVTRDSRKRLKLNRAVASFFEKRLRILSEAIAEVNEDIGEREEIQHRRRSLMDFRKNRIRNRITCVRIEEPYSGPGKWTGPVNTLREIPFPLQRRWHTTVLTLQLVAPAHVEIHEERGSPASPKRSSHLGLRSGEWPAY